MPKWNFGPRLADLNPPILANDASKTRWARRVSTALLRSVGIIVVGLFVWEPSLALADEVPAEFLGTWSTQCDDTDAPKIEMAANSIAIVIDGATYRYTGISASGTWYGGAKADGSRIWLPTSKRSGRKFAFIAAPPPFGTEGPMILEEGVPEESEEIRSIFGAEFHHCPLDHPASTQVLDVPFSDKGGDGQAAWCASSTVSGLDPNGDGYLAVRAGPGTQYRKIDELHNGDIVSRCDARGRWVAVVYGPLKKKGWVNGRWLKDLAG